MMNVSLLLSPALLAVMLSGYSTPWTDDGAGPLPPTDHESAQVQALPDHIRQADINEFGGVTNAIFLGRAGVGEYWQYQQNGKTCIGLFHTEEGVPTMGGLCEGAGQTDDVGFGFTSRIHRGDDIIAQSAWFPGHWDPSFSNQGAIIRYAVADGSGMSPDHDPLTMLFTEEDIPVSVTDTGTRSGMTTAIKGETLRLRTTSR